MATDKRTRSQRLAASLATWRVFLWNSRTREFLGRTGTSWALIISFYVVFYLCLAAMFTFTMWVMLQTVDNDKPKYQDRVKDPGVMIRPKSDGLNVAFNASDPKSYEALVKSINTLLDSYKNQTVEKPRCTPGLFRDSQGSPPGSPPPAVPTACYFNRTALGPCSGETDTSFGYSSGKPCVIIKINRVIDYKPGATNDSATVSCTTLKGGDPGNMTFFPDNTFDPMFFPYYGKSQDSNYRQPLVAVQFLSVPRNRLLQVVCRLAGTNVVVLENNRDKFIGRVEFQLSISA